MQEPTDHDLIQQVAAGHPERLALLFDRYQRRLFSFFLRLGHGRSASDDLVQDTFLRMLRHAATYRGAGHFAGWMFSIARNVANDAWQQRALLEPLADELEALLPAHADHDPPALQEQAMLEQRLQLALLRLPRDARELVLLSRVQELDNAALALLFDCSIGAVKVRLHRTLQQLRKYFDETSDADTPSQEANHAV